MAIANWTRPTVWSVLVVLALICTAPFGVALLAAPVEDEPADRHALLESERLLGADRLEAALATGASTVRVIAHLVAGESVRGFANFGGADASSAHRAEIALLQDDVLSTTSLASDVRVRHRFENLAAFSAEVTLAGLAGLLDDARIERVEAVDQFELHTRQGLALIRGEEIRGAFSGAGTSIAVCDTGIDYNHPQLGGGDFPNEKVIGGFDFAGGDGDPFDENGHGTQVAAIAAGEFGGPKGDYNGGVAPDAKIYALKVTLAGSLIAGTDELIAAWDWCVTHKDDDSENPIRVINSSLGGGRSESICDEEFPGLAAAATNAVNAGIVVVASSGNDGYCDSIAVPACLSNVISVGAVYDDVIGPVVTCVDPFACTGRASGACSTSYLCDDLTTIADLMACYSNTSELLTLLAPGEYATCPALGGGVDDFGGTSAAAPYVAGAIAAMFDAADELTEIPLTPATVESLLVTTGDPVIDPESRVLTPRMNMERAILSLGPAASCQGVDDVVVISVNDQTGLGNGHQVAVSTAGPIIFHMEPPPALSLRGTDALYFVHLNAGFPSSATIVPLPKRLGPACFDFLLARGAKPLAVFNNIGKVNHIGESRYFGEPRENPNPAPADFLTLESGDSANFPVGSEWTLQGAITNPEASARVPVSVTNAVLVTVTD